MALQPTNPQSRSSLTQYPPSSSDILGQLCRYMNNMCCKNFAIHCMMYITWRNVLLLMRQVPGQPHPHNLTIYLTIISSLSRSTTQAKKYKKETDPSPYMDVSQPRYQHQINHQRISLRRIFFQ